MEFLMTYGWAILVVLAAIGALAYFGILSPSKFLPSSCVISGGFSCTEYKVNTTGGILVGVQNNLGSDVILANVTLTTDSCTLTIDSYLNDSGVNNGAKINAAPLTFQCDDDLTAGDKFKGTITIVYQKSGESLTHTTTGTIQAGVE